MDHPVLCMHYIGPKAQVNQDVKIMPGLQIPLAKRFYQFQVHLL